MKKIAVKCKNYEQARQVFKYFDKNFFIDRWGKSFFKKINYPIFVSNYTNYGNLFAWDYQPNHSDFKQISFKKFKRKYLAPCRLKIRIEAWQNVVIMQVLEQDEKLRDKGVLFEYEGFSIDSIICPSLTLDVIYTRGTNKNYDNEISTIYFKTNQQAEEYVTRVKEVVRKFNDEGL